jgi:hypothetical protein
MLTSTFLDTKHGIYSFLVEIQIFVKKGRDSKKD